MHRRSLGVLLTTICCASAANAARLTRPVGRGVVEDPMYVLLKSGSFPFQNLGRIDGYTVGAPQLTHLDTLPTSLQGVGVYAHALGYDAQGARLVFSSSNGWYPRFIARDLGAGVYSALFPYASASQVSELDFDGRGVGYGQQITSQLIERIDLEAQTTSTLAPLVGDVGKGVALAPSGALLVIGADTVLRSVDLTTGAVDTIGPTYLWQLAGIDFTSDGRLIALTRAGQLYEVDPNTGALTALGYVVGVDGPIGTTANDGAIAIAIAVDEPPSWSTSCALGTATLRPYGTGAVSGAPFGLLGSGLPPNVPAFFLVSTDDRLPLTSPLYDGALCLGAPVVRVLSTLGSSSATGMFHRTFDLGAFPSPQGPVALAPDDVRHFQLWYRDVTPTTTSSFSTAVEVMFR